MILVKSHKPITYKRTISYKNKKFKSEEALAKSENFVLLRASSTFENMPKSPHLVIKNFKQNIIPRQIAVTISSLHHTIRIHNLTVLNNNIIKNLSHILLGK